MDLIVDLNNILPDVFLYLALFTTLLVVILLVFGRARAVVAGFVAVLAQLAMHEFVSPEPGLSRVFAAVLLLSGPVAVKIWLAARDRESWQRVEAIQAENRLARR